VAAAEPLQQHQVHRVRLVHQVRWVQVRRVPQVRQVQVRRVPQVR
jgi:hypothetical protein